MKQAIDLKDGKTSVCRAPAAPRGMARFDEDLAKFVAFL